MPADAEEETGGTGRTDDERGVSFDAAPLAGEHCTQDTPARRIRESIELSGGVDADGAEGRNRTADTTIFSRMLYQLSYLGTPCRRGHASRTCKG
jgi:hypothetical protein